MKLNDMRLDNLESAILGGMPFIRNAPVDDFAKYVRGGLFRKVVDKPADKAVALGVEIEGDQNDQISNEFDRLKVVPAIAQALRYARLSGGGVIVMITDDGLWNQPFDESKLGEIVELRIYPLTALSARDVKYLDATKPNFGLPVFYDLRTRGNTITIHESRLIGIPGDPIPESMTVNSVPWAGASVTEACFPAIENYLEVMALAKKIMWRKQQSIYKMMGLAELIQNDMEPAVQKRVALVDKVRSVLNTVVVDSEDDYDLKDMSLNGIKDIIDEAQIQVSAESNIPVTVLFGTSPGGLNATGKSDENSWHEMCQDLQTRATPALERIVHLIYQQNGFTEPATWKIRWAPLDAPSAKETADTAKVEADTLNVIITALNTALGTGAISEQEAREFLAFSHYFGLTDADASTPVEPPPEPNPDQEPDDGAAQ
jgi:phage-related protein (TIGR01555 family)